MHIRETILPTITSLAVYALVQQHAAIAQSPAEINIRAISTTVRIDGTSSGSGVIYSQQGSTYYVLTSGHVVDKEGSYDVVTPDGKRHPIEYNQIVRYPGIDVAELTFSSEEVYAVAEVGDSNRLLPGNSVFVSGWAEQTTTVQERAYIFSEGTVNTLLQNPAQGYSLLYSNSTRQGMSGGPVFDDFGTLVGIHGLADIDGQAGQIGVLGIPINLILGTSPIAQDNLSESSEARDSGQDLEMLISLALEKSQSGDFTGAVIVLNRAIEQNPDSSDAYSERAWTRYGLADGYDPGRNRAIRSDIDRARQLDSSNVSAQLLNFLYQDAEALYSSSFALDGGTTEPSETRKLRIKLEKIGLSDRKSHLRYNAYISYLKYSVSVSFAISNSMNNSLDFDSDFHSQFIKDTSDLIDLLTQVENEEITVPPYPLSALLSDNNLTETKQLVSAANQLVKACRELNPYVSELLVNAHGTFGNSEEHIGGNYAYARALQYFTGRSHPLKTGGPSNQDFDWTKFDEVIAATPSDLVNKCAGTASDS